MMSEGFVDYYDTLQVDPNCSAKALEAAYRHLAKLYHPDHADTANVAKLNEVIEAYRLLRDADQRARYNRLYSATTNFKFAPDKQADDFERAALSDADMHAKILLHLYRRRREHPNDAGVGQYMFQELLGSSYDHLEFHFWYLRAKGFIETTEQGTLAITIDGVDHVISTSRTAQKERLLLGQADDPKSESQF